MPTGAEALVDFVAFAARLKSCPDTERMIKGSWFPTHFAKNAKWMGHGAFVVTDAKSKCGSFDYAALRSG